MPQGLTRLGSTSAAAPGRSDTRLVCRTVPDGVAPGGAAAAPAPSVLREPAASSASTAISRLGNGPKLDSRWFRFILHLHPVCPRLGQGLSERPPGAVHGHLTRRATAARSPSGTPR